MPSHACWLSWDAPCVRPMTSGKQSKRRRREASRWRSRSGGSVAQPRAARPEGRRPGAGGHRRRSSWAAGVAVLAGIAVALVAVLTRIGLWHGGRPRVGSLQNALPGAADVERLFAGIPQEGDTLGRANAPVTLVEYVDMQCPFCREYATEALPVLVRRYVRDGRLRVESRTIAFLGPDSTTGQQAGIAAGEQGKAFNLEQLLFFNQGPENTGWLSDDVIGPPPPRACRDARAGAACRPPRRLGREPGACIRRAGDHGRGRLDADDPRRQDRRLAAARRPRARRAMSRPSPPQSRRLR